jgi:hypothetical protein
MWFLVVKFIELVPSLTVLITAQAPPAHKQHGPPVQIFDYANRPEDLPVLTVGSRFQKLTAYLPAKSWVVPSRT